MHKNKVKLENIDKRFLNEYIFNTLPFYLKYIKFRFNINYNFSIFLNTIDVTYKVYASNIDDYVDKLYYILHYTERLERCERYFLRIICNLFFNIKRCILYYKSCSFLNLLTYKKALRYRYLRKSRFLISTIKILPLIK